MGRNARPFAFLTFACAFSSCFAAVALGVELSPETTSFHHTATSAQPLSLYHSSPHQDTTVHFNSTGSLETTPVQTTGQPQVTTAPAHHAAGAATTQVTGQTPPTVVPTTSADNATQAVETVTAAVENTTSQSVSSTKQAANVSTEMTVASTNSTINCTTPNTQMTTTATTTTAATMQTVKPTTGSGNQTTAHQSPTTTAMANRTTIRPGTQTTVPSTTTTARPTLAPRPSPIPTGTYTVSSGNRTCIKAVMGLQLMAQNAQKKQMEYMAVNPNATQTSGSCGTMQSELNITFSGGFIIFTFVKLPPTLGTPSLTAVYNAVYNQVAPFRWPEQNCGAAEVRDTSCSAVRWRDLETKSSASKQVGSCVLKEAPTYHVSKIESRLQLSSGGMLYYAAIREKLFTTTLGNSFKCASKQTFGLEKNFQLLIVNMQLQAFDIVGNQFGKEEECFPDKNRKAAPIAVGLSILGLFVIVFVTFLISRRKPHRGYERI